MDSENLLANIATVFDTSNHNSSQDLLKKIINLAAQKLNCSNNSKDHQGQKTQQPIAFIMSLFNQNVQKPKRKLISKGKLRRIAIKKIANKNQRIHENFIKANNQKQFKIEKKKTQIINLSNFSLEKEQHKLQSNEQDNENQALYPNQQICFINTVEKREKGGKKAMPQKKIIRKRFKKTRKNFQNYLKSSSKESKTDDITCPVCIQTLIDPVSTICGHSFCFRCLDESLLFGSNCPVCRLHIKGYEIMPCTNLKELIKVKCAEFLDDQSAIETYLSRKQQNEEWKNTRFINPSKINQGDSLDVRDTENIWCKAMIQKIYCVNGKVSSILVHYQQWAKIYDQVIEIDSIRLAPKEFFSSRQDIPRYNLGNEEENLRGAVITGNNNESFLRSGSNDLAFSNILQLNSLRSRISSLQNNVISQMIPVSFIQNSNQVGFLHHVILPVSDESDEQVIVINEMDLPDYQSSEENQDGNGSSLGSFAFGQPTSPIYESIEYDGNGSEIREPANQQYISIHGSSEQGNEDGNESEEQYWNARPQTFEERVHYEEFPMQESYENMDILSPFYRQIIPNELDNADFDEHSYGEHSYSN